MAYDQLLEIREYVVEVGVDLDSARQTVFTVGLDALSKGLDGVAEGLVAAVLVEKF